MLVSFTKKFKFVINIIIKLSHTKNRLVIKNASFLLQVYVNFFPTYDFSLSLKIRHNF